MLQIWCGIHSPKDPDAPSKPPCKKWAPGTRGVPGLCGPFLYSKGFPFDGVWRPRRRCCRRCGGRARAARRCRVSASASVTAGRARRQAFGRGGVRAAAGAGWRRLHDRGGGSADAQIVQLRASSGSPAAAIYSRKMTAFAAAVAPPVREPHVRQRVRGARLVSV